MIPGKQAGLCLGYFKEKRGYPSSARPALRVPSFPHSFPARALARVSGKRTRPSRHGRHPEPRNSRAAAKEVGSLSVLELHELDSAAARRGAGRGACRVRKAALAAPQLWAQAVRLGAIIAAPTITPAAHGAPAVYLVVRLGTPIA